MLKTKTKMATKKEKKNVQFLFFQNRKLKTTFQKPKIKNKKRNSY